MSHGWTCLDPKTGENLLSYEAWDGHHCRSFCPLSSSFYAHYDAHAKALALQSYLSKSDIDNLQFFSFGQPRDPEVP
jgi:hypothetical protein